MPDGVHRVGLYSNGGFSPLPKTLVGQSPVCEIQRKLLDLPEITEDFGIE